MYLACPVDALGHYQTIGSNRRDPTPARAFFIGVRLKNKRRKPRSLWSLVAPLVRGAMNAKVKGAVGELAFMLKAASLGFGVSKPHADTEHYDFIVDSGKRLSRVQVKSTSCVFHSGYRASSYRGDAYTVYKSDEIDFLVVYIVPRNIWYIIPVSAIAGLTTVTLYPDGSNGGRFEIYREAWHLLADYTLPPSAPK